MNSSDSFQLDEHLARLLAAYEQGIDGGDDKAPTIAPARLLPPPPPLPGERVLTPLSRGAANEAPLGELLPDSENPNAPPPPPVPPPPPPAPSAATPRVGRFELRRQLGKGGCGIVFLAYDPKLEREVALKIPRPEMLMSQDARRRLVREALAAAEFDHPNLVPVYETGEIGPVCFIATAFCPGQTLGEWLDKQAFPVSARQAARLVATVAEAVQHAHDRGVLHRDLKPTNVILQATKDDPNEQEPPPGSCQLRGDHYIPRVVDFGLAKLVERGGPSETATRQILGTPKYMSPEQALGRHDDVGPAADVYALGVILYEMLAGRAPYEGASDVEVLRLAVEGHLTPPRHLRADIPRDLEAICLKAMDRSPARRYRTAIDLADDLRRFLDDKPTLARPLNWVGRAGRWLRRNDQVVALATVTFVAVFFFSVWAWNRYETQRLSSDRDMKQQAEEAARNRADQQREYSRDVRQAFLAWRAGDAATAAEALGAARKQTSAMDPAEFTLGYLARLVAAGRLYVVCPAGAVTALAVSADGSRLASRHADGTIALWNRATGEQLAAVKAAVLDGWLLPDRGRIDWQLPLPGGFVANGPAGRVLLRTDRSYELPTGDLGDVRAGAVTRDGRTLFTAGDDGIIRSWDLATDLRDRGAVAAAGPVTAIGVDPDGRSFAVAAGDSVRTAFGTTDERPGPGGHVFVALRILKDGTTLGVEFPRTGVAVISQLTARQQAEKVRLALPDGAAAVSADLAADGTRVAVGDDRGRVIVWNVPDGTALALIDCGHRRPIPRVALSTDGMSVAAPTEGNKVGVWAVGTPDPQLTFAADDQTVFRFLPGGRLATAGRGGAIRIWSLMNGQEEAVLHGHVGRVSGLGISPDGRTLASGGATGEVKLWDLRTGQELLGLRRHSGPVDVIEFAANGKLLVTGGFQVAVWEVRE